MEICKEKFKAARVLVGLSLEDVASYGGVSVRTIQNWEHKGGDVNLHILKAIARKMKVDPQSLVIGK